MEQTEINDLLQLLKWAKFQQQIIAIRIHYHDNDNLSREQYIFDLSPSPTLSYPLAVSTLIFSLILLVSYSVLRSQAGLYPGGNR